LEMAVGRVGEWLDSAGLGYCAENFAGIDEKRFLSLAMQDYADLQVTSMLERKRLFSLIQSLRREGIRPVAFEPTTQPVRDAKENERPPQAPQREAAPAPIPKVSENITYEEEQEYVPRELPPRRTSVPMQRAVTRNAPGAGQDRRSRNDRIRVTVRKRPMLRKELAKGDVDVLETDGRQALTVFEPKTKVDLTKYVEKHQFFFDGVFDYEVTNEEIYSISCQPLIGYIFQQGKATCFAYGQTGAGKTFTMMGNQQQPGQYMLAARDIFATLPQYPHLSVWVSFYEIYGGKLYDLLNERKRLVAREDGAKNVNICGLEEREVFSVDELINAMDSGNSARSTACTGANADSSRSHAILAITLKDKREPKQNQSVCHGKFSFIDLAGSERAADTTDNDRTTRIESAEINKSLLALKECIRALDQDHTHIPFRGSKLTEVLRDSFIGECRTVMIANVAPNISSCEHTMNTLRYAYRVKELRKPSGERVGGLWEDLEGMSFPKNAAKPAGPTRAASEPAGGRPRSAPGVRERGPATRAEQQGDEAPHHHQPSRAAAPARRLEQAASAASQQQNLLRRRQSWDDGDSLTPSSVVEELTVDECDQDADQPDELARTHEELVTNILNEEDTVIAFHRRQIEDNMELVQREMLLLQAVEQPGGSIDEYVVMLDRLLEQKVGLVTRLREHLAEFQSHLKEEEQLSHALNTRRSP